MALDKRHVHVVSSLPPDQLLLQRVRGTEELGRLSEFELELLSPDPGLKIDDLLGDRMTVVLSLADGERFFNGHVARFGQSGLVGRYTRYRCTLRPFPWLYTRASDSRIFKQMTIPEIVKHVVAQFGVGQIEDALQGTYLSREYTVMYRETYFDFISRLMEEEGIYYYFKHTKDQHSMVLCDDHGSHKKTKGCEKVPFIDPAVNASPREEHFSEWTTVHQVSSGAFAVNDFDFEAPREDLLARARKALPHKHADMEQYDPVAGFVEALDAGNNGDVNRHDRAQLFARVRLEEAQATYDRAEALGNVRGLATGALVEITGHTRSDQNREVLVVAAEYHMFQPGFDAGSSTGADREKDKAAGQEEPLYEVRATMQPSKQPFRPERVTPRPQIGGPHAGVVVGSGEIWTDKYGRVKVHFPWDREDKDGCWMRVAQVWAGGGWGALQVPRVGQEVIVEFLEGDPDRPIITGRVYNGANAPPFAPPGGATISGILTRSTPGGSADNASELRFEDKKGSEQLFLHAERNMDSEVEKDQTLWVGQDRTNKIDRHQSETIGGNKTIHVKQNHDELIDQNMTLKVQKNEDETIGGNRTINVTGDHTETIAGTQGVSVSKDGAWSVGGNGAMTFGGTGAFSVGKKLTEDVGADYSLSVAANATVGVSKAMNVSVTKALGVQVDDAMTLGVAKDSTVSIDGANKVTVTKEFGLEAKKVTVEGEDQIIIKCGSAQITLKKGGDIEIKGGKISVNGSSDLVMKGSKIAQN